MLFLFFQDTARSVSRLLSSEIWKMFPTSYDACPLVLILHETFSDQHLVAAIGVNKTQIGQQTGLVVLTADDVRTTFRSLLTLSTPGRPSCGPYGTQLEDGPSLSDCSSLHEPRTLFGLDRFREALITMGVRLCDQKTVSLCVWCSKRGNPTGSLDISTIGSYI